LIFIQAWRSWLGAKAVALLAIAALAVGIGSATSIYTIVNALMFKPLPYRDGELFVALFSGDLNDPGHYGSLTFQDAVTFSQRTRAFDAFGWFREAGKNMMYAGSPLHVQGVAVTPDLVLELGADPILGQWFRDDSGVVISNALWRKLGSDPGIVGKPLTLDGRSYVVTGVMPNAFGLPIAGATTVGLQADLWMALDPRRGESGVAFFAYARRKPDVSFTAAEADVKRVAAEIGREDPARHSAYTARLFDLRETVIKEIRPTLLLLFGAAGLFFLITCGNAAGLLLARSVARAQETAVRIALGAGRKELAAHYFTEGLLVSVAGALAGVFFSLTLTRAIVSFAADYLPRASEVTVDWRVLLFALAAAIVASLLVSLAPLWQASRTMPADVLGDGVRGSAGVRTRRISGWLVVAEIALAFALMAVSAVLLAHLRNLSRVSTGFDPEPVLSVTLSVPGTIGRDPAKRIPLQTRLLEGMRSIPGVEESAVTSHVPLDGCCVGTSIYPEGIAIDPNAPQRTSLMGVSPSYFRAMRVALKAGRLFTDFDRVENVVWAVISESAVKRYWDGQNPVGAYGRFGTAKGDRFQVLGVVGDVKNDGLGNPSVPEIYIPSSILNMETVNFVLRSFRPPSSLISDVRGVVRNIDPELPVTNIAPMRDVVQKSLSLERAASLLTTFFAGAALLMAMLGVYGVVSYATRQRTVEIGTRIALGATRQGVLSLIVRDGLKMAAFGVIAGAVAGLAAVYSSRSFFSISEVGPIPFLYSTGIVTGLAAASSLFPALRASMLSPMVAIRNQPESMWQFARRQARRVIEEISSIDSPAVPVETIVADFMDSVRHAAAFPDAVQTALGTLRDRFGAKSIVLRDPKNGGLQDQLSHYPYPLIFDAAYLETWLKWADQFCPEQTAEIRELMEADARIAVGLWTKKEIVGVLLLGAPEGHERYTSAQKQALSSYADVFALLLENARLTERAIEQEKINRDLALAGEVQKRLLPLQPPSSPFESLAAFSLPARTVGGDYHDFLNLSDGRIGVAVADISGKGIAAAIVMSVVQASLRILTNDADIPLSELAAKMNRFLYRSTGGSKYATFFYLQIEDGGKRLRYVNAGHNPPYLARRGPAEVEIIELPAGGPPMGLFPVLNAEESQLAVLPGDLIVAFSDGVTEALNDAGEEFGEERLQALVRQAFGHRAEEVSQRISEEVRAWMSGTEQHDDVTVVVIQISGALPR
jgi:predicted permease